MVKKNVNYTAFLLFTALFMS